MADPVDEVSRIPPALRDIALTFSSDVYAKIVIGALGASPIALAWVVGWRGRPGYVDHAEPSATSITIAASIALGFAVILCLLERWRRGRRRVVIDEAGVHLYDGGSPYRSIAWNAARVYRHRVDWKFKRTEIGWHHACTIQFQGGQGEIVSMTDAPSVRIFGDHLPRPPEPIGLVRLASMLDTLPASDKLQREPEDAIRFGGFFAGLLTWLGRLLGIALLIPAFEGNTPALYEYELALILWSAGLLLRSIQPLREMLAWTRVLRAATQRSAPVAVYRDGAAQAGHGDPAPVARRLRRAALADLAVRFAISALVATSLIRLAPAVRGRAAQYDEQGISRWF